MSQDEAFLKIMDSVARSCQTAIHDANVRLAHEERPAVVALEFLERVEVAMTLAKQQLPTGA
jgi:hypothetical protein